MSKYTTIEIEKYCEIFKALSNPNRLKIFLKLISDSTVGQKCVHDLHKPDLRNYIGTLGKNLDIVPSTISHHIKELRRAGLIKMSRNKQYIECFIEPAVVKKLEFFFKIK